jgi:RNA polymerase sigma-70 factor (ECF subfamily)
MASGTDIRTWFEEVVRENYRLLYSVAYTVLQHEGDAEDATQEGVLRAFRKLDTLKDRRTTVPWLAQIVRRAAIDMRRKGTWRHARTMGEDDARLEDHRDRGEGLHEDQKRLLLEEVGKLPPGQALVVTLRYVEDLSIGEIAERLGLNPSTTRVRLHYGINALRRRKRLRKAIGMDT